MCIRDRPKNCTEHKLKEITEHKKSTQTYSKSQQLAIDSRRRAMQLVTRGKYQGLKMHHQLRRLSPFNHHVKACRLHQHNRANAFKATIVRALKTGCIWDEQLKKWLSLHDLLNHPNPEVRACWEKIL